MKITAGSFVVRATEPVQRAYLHSVIVLGLEPSMLGRPPPPPTVSIDKFFPQEAQREKRGEGAEGVALPSRS